MKTFRRALVAAIFSFLFIAAYATLISADAGVGIMPSQIEVDKAMAPGSYKALPALQVVNTGDQPARYAVQLTAFQEQQELKAGTEFFDFYPGDFMLEPGKNQIISLSLNIPLNARPGDYLALIEARPQREEKVVYISIAAASRIYFTVKPANLVQAVWVWTNSFMERRAPWSYVVPMVMLVGVILWMVRRNLKVEVKVERRRK